MLEDSKADLAVSAIRCFPSENEDLREEKWIRHNDSCMGLSRRRRGLLRAALFPNSASTP